MILIFNIFFLLSLCCSANENNSVLCVELFGQILGSFWLLSEDLESLGRVQVTLLSAFLAVTPKSVFSLWYNAKP